MLQSRACSKVVHGGAWSRKKTRDCDWSWRKVILAFRGEGTADSSLEHSECAGAEGRCRPLTPIKKSVQKFHCIHHHTSTNQSFNHGTIWDLGNHAYPPVFCPVTKDDLLSLDVHWSHCQSVLTGEMIKRKKKLKKLI